MKTFKKTFKIYAEASDVYSALTNPFTIELWSGYPAEMSEEPAVSLVCGKEISAERTWNS